MKQQETRHAVGRLLNRLVIWLWATIWHRWLFDSRSNKMRVVKVKGWRTALVESDWQARQTITPCFTLLGYEFD